MSSSAPSSDTISIQRPHLLAKIFVVLIVMNAILLTIYPTVQTWPMWAAILTYTFIMTYCYYVVLIWGVLPKQVRDPDSPGAVTSIV